MRDQRYCRGSLWHEAIPLGCTQHHLRPETNYLLHDRKKTIRDACHQHSEHIQAASDPLVVPDTPRSATARVWRGEKTLTAAGDDGADGRDSIACGRRGGRCTSGRARGKATNLIGYELAGCRSHDLQLYHCMIENCATLDIFTYYIAKYIRISLFKIYTTVCQAVKHDCGHHPTKTRTSLYGILKILDRIFFKITIIYFKSS